MRICLYILFIIGLSKANEAISQSLKGWEFAHNNKQYTVDFDSQKVVSQTYQYGYDSLYARNTEYNTFSIGTKLYAYTYFDSMGKPFIVDVKTMAKHYISTTPISKYEIFQGYIFKPVDTCNTFILFSVLNYSNSKIIFHARKFVLNPNTDSISVKNIDTFTVTVNNGNGRFAKLYFQTDNINNTVWTLFTYYGNDQFTKIVPIKISSKGKITTYKHFSSNVYLWTERGYYNPKYSGFAGYNPTGSQAIFSRDFKKCYFSNIYSGGTNAVVECDFDITTGSISNEVQLIAPSSLPRDMGVFGLAISPNDSILYLAIREEFVHSPMPREAPYIIQYNRFNKKRYNLKTRGAFYYEQYYYYPFVSFMDFGNDGKLYFGIIGDQPYREFYKIGRVEYPNKLGAACGANFEWWTLSKSPFLPACVGRIGSFDGSFYPYNFQITNNNVCSDSTRFRIQVKDTFNALTLYFGDGDSAVLQGTTSQTFYIAHKYTNSGKYRVALKILKPFCGQTQWAFDTAIVRFKPQLFYSDLDTILVGCNKYILSLADSTAFAMQQIISWGDGINDTLQAGNFLKINHQYLAADTFSVLLTLNNLNDGCSTSVGFPIIAYFLPKPLFKLYTQTSAGWLKVDTFLGKTRFNGCNPLSFQLIDSGYQNKTIIVERNGIDTISYDFIHEKITIPVNDSFFQNTSVLHKLTLMDINGCEVTDSIYTHVFESPKVYFTSDDTVICENTPFIALAHLQQNPTGTIWNFKNTYLWDSTLEYRQLANYNDTVWTEIPIQPIQSPIGWKPRAYNLTIYGKSPDGCVAIDDLYYRVTTNPQSGFTTSADSICLPNRINISNTATSIYDSIVNITYHLGNGTTLSQPNILDYLYDTDGRYQIKQIATTAEACIDSFSKTILIKDYIPSAFTTNSLKQCSNGNLLTISDTATNGSYKIRFGDGAFENSIPAKHTYSKAGIYPLELIKSWNNGCSDTQHLTVTIHKNPVADFTVPLLCSGNISLLKNKSIYGDTSLTTIWHTSDSGIYSTTDLIRYFNTAGELNIQLMVADYFGCKDSMQKTASVHLSPAPVMYFQGIGFDPVLGFGYQFYTIPDTFIQYSWKLGTSETSDNASAKAWFKQANSLEKISLTVKNKTGCATSIDSIIEVKGLTMYLFPNSFTPNGDGKNEGFGIGGPEYVKTYKLWIYNRWGEQVFYTENPFELWNPEKPMPGMYVYKAKVQDIYNRWLELQGTVNLLR